MINIYSSGKLAISVYSMFIAVILLSALDTCVYIVLYNKWVVQGNPLEVEPPQWLNCDNVEDFKLALETRD